MKNVTELLQAKPNAIAYGLVGPTDAIFLPPGCLVVERMLGQRDVIGVRVGLLPKVEQSPCLISI